MLFYNCCVPAQSPYLEKSCARNIGQNTNNQSDSRILKSTISAEQINEIAWFFACWYEFTKNKNWSKDF